MNVGSRQNIRESLEVFGIKIQNSFFCLFVFFFFFPISFFETRTLFRSFLLFWFIGFSSVFF